MKREEFMMFTELFCPCFKKEVKEKNKNELTPSGFNDLMDFCLQELSAVYSKFDIDMEVNTLEENCNGIVVKVFMDKNIIKRTLCTLVILIKQESLLDEDGKEYNILYSSEGISLVLYKKDIVNGFVSEEMKEWITRSVFTQTVGEMLVEEARHNLKLYSLYSEIFRELSMEFSHEEVEDSFDEDFIIHTMNLIIKDYQLKKEVK